VVPFGDGMALAHRIGARLLSKGIAEGKSLGKLGTVEDVLGRTIVYKVGDEVNQTKRRYAFVIGDQKALISVEA